MTPERRFRPIGILAPTGRDAEVTARVLEHDGFSAIVFADMRALSDAIGDGIGALLIAEEALGPDRRAALLEALGREPAWSDIPVIVLTGENELSGAPSRALADIAERVNLTLLERPVRRATLVTTLRSALRARKRQFQVRDYLEERQRNEVELREAREDAEIANSAKMRFLATMSHELRTPLNAIAGYTELMSMELHGPLTPEQRADLQRIDRSQRYLLSLINDILNFAKIESGQVAMSVRSFPIDPLLRDLEPFVSPQLVAKRVDYSYRPQHEGCFVKADPEKVQQVLLNLLSNAVKFTPAQGSIAVGCSSAGEMVCITVSDTGPGVPPGKREAIFEPFVQLDRGLTSTAQGTGLGLSISRDLARTMGGDLFVDEAPGGGARFTLLLPAASQEVEHAAA